MDGWLIIAKILVSVTFVVGLSLVAEHVSPRVAGILSGYPLGAAISLFFIGYENGREFAAQGALYTLGGLSASLVFVYFYYRVSARVRRYELLASAVAAIAAFLVAGKVLSQLDLGLGKALLITVTAIFVFSFQFRHIENTMIGKKVRFTPSVLGIRAITAALIILLVTGIAKWVGPNWAGVLAAFPVTLFPLLVLVHVAYGREQVHTIIKNFPYGLGSLIIYVTTVRFSYPVIGVGLGTATSFAAATLYLIGFSAVSRKLAERKKAAARAG